VLRQKSGWLLRLERTGGRHGVIAGAPDLGWGEAAPLPVPGDPAASARELGRVAAAIDALGPRLGRAELERILPALPPSLAFALGAALAELDGLVGAAAEGWLDPPPPAWLLPAGPAAPQTLDQVLESGAGQPGGPGAAPLSLTVKWKVAAAPAAVEFRVLEELLARLPPEARLRLDANGGWTRATAGDWAARLAGDPRLEWLEQPLDPADHAGLEALAAGPPAVPVALDESLAVNPGLRLTWTGWQVRRPSQEGDPRPLLARLRAGAPRLMLSTGFETGIGSRWVHHLAALQALGPTPAAPGLAPGWGCRGALAGSDPERVWAAAAAGWAEPPESV
jgi:O-succinylbenzoate synthase